jgi:hypothetical protein
MYLTRLLLATTAILGLAGAAEKAQDIDAPALTTTTTTTTTLDPNTWNLPCSSVSEVTITEPTESSSTEYVVTETSTSTEILDTSTLTTSSTPSAGESETGSETAPTTTATEEVSGAGCKAPEMAGGLVVGGIVALAMALA